MDLDTLAVALRAGQLAATFLGAGAALFLRLVMAEGDPARPHLRRLARAGTLAAMVLTSAHQCVEVARLGGDLAAVADADLEALAWHSRGGLVHAAQLLGLAIMAIALSSARRGASTGAAFAGLAAVAALAGAGHTSVHRWHALLTPLLMAHVIVAAFWFGSLVPLLLAVRRRAGISTVLLLQRFSLIAGPGVAVLGIAGGLIGATLVPTIHALARPYGMLLACKFTGLCFLLVLAAWNRWRGSPALAQGGAAARRRLTVTISAELLLLSAILAITALLTTRFGPED